MNSAAASPSLGRPAARPLLGFGRVFHDRLRPSRNTFSYPTAFLLLPMRTLAKDPAAAGALMSALFGITLFSRLGVGMFLARGGVFRVMLSMSLLHAVGTWVVLASSSPVTLVAGLMAMGLGFGGYLPAFGSLVRGIFPAAQAGRRLSELYLLGFMGAGVGSWLVGALRDWRGGQWDASFVTMATLATIGPAILLARRGAFERARTSQ